MLSDTLFDAVQEIEYYQKEFPTIYDYYRDELDEIKKRMEKIRTELDNPSSSNEK